MKSEPDRFTEFVEHPRYGRRPRVTGLNPQPSDEGVNLHGNATTYQEVVSQYEAVIGPWPYGILSAYAGKVKRIPQTAVPADLNRQSRATVPVTHYFDLEKLCRDCNGQFIFFAVEQKHWYETLGFPLEADAVRCPLCRKQNQALGRSRATYEQLLKIKNRTEIDTSRLTESLLTLVENGIFNARQTEHARALVKTLSNGTRDAFLSRIRRIENTMNGDA